MYNLNNKGSALVTALLIITLIFIFSSVLISTALTTVKQTELTEKQIQATNLAEMAIMYFEEYAVSQVKAIHDAVKAFQTVNPYATGEQLTEEFCNRFHLSNISNIPITIDPLFRAEIFNVTIDRRNCNQGQVEIQFKSKGVYNGAAQIIHGNFLVKNNSSISGGTGISRDFPSIPASFTNNCSSLEDCDGQRNVVSIVNNKVDKKMQLQLVGCM